MVPVMLAGVESCCTPPGPDYVRTAEGQQEVATLKNDLLALLPPERKEVKAADCEAAWLAETAIVQSAAIARYNRTELIGWINNILVNSAIRDRGLCWQVQQDLYRDLRKRPLKFFRLGMTVRDRKTRREHSCVYLNAAGKGLEGSLVLDAWCRCGHLKVLTPEDREGERWEEDWREPMISAVFPEGHQYGIDDHAVWSKSVKSKGAWLGDQIREWKSGQQAPVIKNVKK